LKLYSSGMFSPIPLKKVFKRDDEIICEPTKAKKASIRNRGLD